MTVRHLAASSVALALALVAPGPAFAQSVAPAPAPTAAPAPAPAVAAPAAPEEPVHFVLTIGADFGSTKLVEVTMSDGSTKSLKANQGLNMGVGLSFLKLADNLLATQATIGFEYSAIDASNGSIRWLAFPLEVMEVVYLDPIRLGAGISYLLSPSVKGDGDAAGFDLKLKNSAGLVFQGDYVYRFQQSARAGRMTLGVRYVVQSLEAKSFGGVAVSGNTKANAFGLALGFLL